MNGFVNYALGFWEKIYKGIKFISPQYSPVNLIKLINSSVSDETTATDHIIKVFTSAYHKKQITLETANRGMSMLADQIDFLDQNNKAKIGMSIVSLYRLAEAMGDVTPQEKAFNTHKIVRDFLPEGSVVDGFLNCGHHTTYGTVSCDLRDPFNVVATIGKAAVASDAWDTYKDNFDKESVLAGIFRNAHDFRQDALLRDTLATLDRVIYYTGKKQGLIYAARNLKLFGLGRV